MHFPDFLSSTTPHPLARLVACALLPACIQEATAATPSHLASRPKSVPYLHVCPPSPLRFAEPVEVAADPVSSTPAVIGPPHPAGIVEEIAAMNQEAVIPPHPPAPVVTPAASVPSPLAPEPGSQSESSPETAGPQSGISILPDETPREIRSEDVLFYFQFPASAPSNEALPRSSATYRQQ